MALENKLGIISSPELAEAEERISKKMLPSFLTMVFVTPSKQVKLHR